MPGLISSDENLNEAVLKSLKLDSCNTFTISSDPTASNTINPANLFLKEITEVGGWAGSSYLLKNLQSLACKLKDESLACKLKNEDSTKSLAITVKKEIMEAASITNGKLLDQNEISSRKRKSRSDKKSRRSKKKRRHRLSKKKTLCKRCLL